MKRLLDNAGILYTFIEVDLLEQDEKIRVNDELKRINPVVSFPTLRIDDTVIVGFKKDDIRAALNLEPTDKTGWIKRFLSKFKG